MGLGVVVAAFAAVATRAAAGNDAVWSALNALKESASLVPAHHWSQGSSFPDLAAIYFFLAWPVFPAALGAFVTRYWTQDSNEHIAPGFELKAGFGGVVMLVLGPGSLWAMDGVEMMGLPIGTRLANLLIFGWVHFALAGCLTGLGVIALRRVFALSR
ncbi:hypothetical protein L2Y96_06660 [Luteibacter aegosomaticola]|uniref:hypothetical protein n=1 Tax=Luteibacter aegosomaticola TaxID=2911538 RepID=UPI001FFA58A9|nr:hypothetical protein [Luteibacter aegosomaticola]UPG91449.1 hypothetical protein L2Y96_06660 [Luteibacter aegosomaticola]